MTLLDLVRRIARPVRQRFDHPGAAKATPTAGAPQALDDVYDGVVRAVAPITMVHATGVRFTAEQAVRLAQSDVPGVFVECGVWKGGCSLAMLLAQRTILGRVVRPVYMLDSFQGLPTTTERDGPLATAWQKGAQPDTFLDNCRASLADLRTTMAEFGFSEQDYRILPGWFRDTLPELVTQLPASGISLLRLDCDWYTPMTECMDALMPLVSEEGCVVLDDYYAWDGCARAVHDYLSRHDLPYRIKSLYGNFGAYMIKRGHRRRFDEF